MAQTIKDVITKYLDDRRRILDQIEGDVALAPQRDQGQRQSTQQLDPWSRGYAAITTGTPGA